MLAIRLQRTGRSGHAMFRIIVQDSRKSPTSGKLVAQLGHYDPHTKDIKIDKEKAEVFLKNGAQPSERVISLLKSQGVKLPKWVIAAPAKQKAVKNPEKRRSTAPETPAEPVAEVPAEEVTSEETAPEVNETKKEPDTEAETPEVAETPEITDDLAPEEPATEVAAGPDEEAKDN